MAVDAPFPEVALDMSEGLGSTVDTHILRQFWGLLDLFHAIST